MWSNWNSPTLLEGVQNDMTLDNSLPFFKLNIHQPYSSAIPLLSILHKRNKNICQHKYLCRVVYSSLIHTSQNLEATQMSMKTFVV